MSRFLGTHLNRLDAKGRVSVPAAFRAVLRGGREDGPVTVVLQPSLLGAGIHAMPVAALERMARAIEALDPDSLEYEQRALAFYGDSYQIDLDKEGRLVIPENLAVHAGLSEQVAFVGMGEKFQIFAGEAVEARLEAARAAVKSRRAAP